MITKNTNSQLNEQDQVAVKSIATRCVQNLLMGLGNVLEAVWDKFDNQCRMNHSPAADQSEGDTKAFADELLTQIESLLASHLQGESSSDIVASLIRQDLEEKILNQVRHRRIQAEAGEACFGASR